MAHCLQCTSAESVDPMFFLDAIAHAECESLHCEVAGSWEHV